MTLIHTIDLLICGAVMLLVFAIVPLASFAGPPSAWSLGGWAIAFTRTALFTSVLGLLSGSVQLSLPGVVCVAYILFMVLQCWSAGHIRAVTGTQWVRQQFALVLTWLDSGWSGVSTRWRQACERVFVRAPAGPSRNLLLFAAILALMTSLPAIRSMRFFSDVAYSQAVSLQTLTLGQPWRSDGSVSFLAPVVFFSGLDGMTVIRYSSSIFLGFIAVTSGYLGLRAGGSTAAAIAAAGITTAAAQAMSEGGYFAGLLFWLLAVALYPDSRWDSLWAASTALLVGGTGEPQVLIPLTATLLVLVMMRLARPLAAVLRGCAVPLALASLLLAIVLPLRRSNSEGPLQHELAARSAWRIAREQPRNNWMIISPAHELAFTYGRGWHMQLVDFVGRYRPEDVANADFRFGFPVRDVFVFIEKRPLVNPRTNYTLAGLGVRFDPAMATYQSSLGRQSLQFQAAKLLAAYAASHPGVSMYVEDDAVAVYRITE